MSALSGWGPNLFLSLDHKLLEDEGVPSSWLALGHPVGIPQTLGCIVVFNLLGGDLPHLGNLMKTAVDSGPATVCVRACTHTDTQSLH